LPHLIGLGRIGFIGKWVSREFGSRALGRGVWRVEEREGLKSAGKPVGTGPSCLGIQIQSALRLPWTGYPQLFSEHTEPRYCYQFSNPSSGK